MTALLIIATAGMLLLGYFVMRRVDAFLAAGSFPESVQGRRSQGLLICGSRPEAEKLRGLGFACTEIRPDTLPERTRYAALFALTDSDASNLRLCRDMKERDPGITVIARCLTPELAGVYRSVGADRVLLPGESLDGFISALREIRT